MKAYKDLEGTQPAEDGDRVALVIEPDSSEWRQPAVNKRPTLRDYSSLFGGAKTLGIECDDGETMTQTANQLIE